MVLVASAAVVAAPLAKLLRIGNVLGYLLVCILIGPQVLGLVFDVTSVLHFAEFGVIMLLFVIGLDDRASGLKFGANATPSGGYFVLATDTGKSPFRSGILLARLFWRLDPNFFRVVLRFSGPPRGYLLRHSAYRLSIGTSMCFGVFISMLMLLFALTPRVKRK